MAKKKEAVSTRAPFEIADQIGDVRKQMAALKELDVKLTAEFKEACHQRQITEAGGYFISKSYPYKVKNQELAMKFALEHNAVKIDTSTVKEIFRHMLEKPSVYGFEETVIESVRPVGKNKNEDGD